MKFGIILCIDLNFKNPKKISKIKKLLKGISIFSINMILKNIAIV